MATHRFRFDLGIRSLIPQWKFLLTTDGLKQDVIAGATVACIALPLSLAIALASGVPPGIGLISAIIAGIVCALFGGTPLAISGPAAAMAVLVDSIVQEHGLSSLLIIGLGCGALQVLTGVFDLGRFLRFVPLPVVAGFTAGIGAIILIGQIPRALGLPPPPESHVVDVILHIKDLIHETNPNSLALVAITLLILFVLPRVLPKLPAPLIALIIPSVVAHFFVQPVATIGAIPQGMPLPKLPAIPDMEFTRLISGTVAVFALGSLETLLSSSSVDRLSHSPRHDPDQELIGQGLGNFFCALFGGIPVTGVIARSALNVQAGARTRRASVVHAILLILALAILGTWMGQIPIAVLAGVLVSVAIRMLHPRELIQLWKSARADAVIYLITFAAIVWVDLIMGVQAGIGAALLIAAIRLGHSRTLMESDAGETGPIEISLTGPLTFLSSAEMDSVRKRLAHVDPDRSIIFNLSEVTSMDASGATSFMEILGELIKGKKAIALKGLAPSCRKILFSADQSEQIVNLVAAHEMEILQILSRQKPAHEANMDRLAYGVQQFRKARPESSPLFRSLAQGQSPHTLFITCSDSRINPNLITSTDPGELFIIRNVGNLIPPFGEDETPAEGAAVEYALGVLGVKEIIVCGHSGCGAMQTLLNYENLDPHLKAKLPCVMSWLKTASSLKKQLPTDCTVDYASELNAIFQIEHLRTYPIVEERLKKNEVTLHAWFYDIGKGELEEWDEKSKMFVTIGSQKKRSLQRRIESGTQYQAPFIRNKNDD